MATSTTTTTSTTMANTCWISMTVSPTDKQQFNVPTVADLYLDYNLVKQLWIVFVVPPDVAPLFKFPTKKYRFKVICETVLEL